MMKKEFAVATANFDFGFVNLKNGVDENYVKELVTYLVLDNQLSGLVRKLPIDDWSKVNVGSDFWTADRDTFTTEVCDPSEVDSILEIRKNALAVKNAQDALSVTMQDYNDLGNTDKCFILIEAHKNAPSIMMTKDLISNFVDFKSFSDTIERIYRTASVNKDAKNEIRSIIYKIMGKDDGKLFNALAPTKAELRKSDIMHFVAEFSASAKREKVKDKNGEYMKPYDYVLKGGWKAQSQAITTLIGVIMESRRDSYCNVVRQ